MFNTTVSFVPFNAIGLRSDNQKPAINSVESIRDVSFFIVALLINLMSTLCINSFYLTFQIIQIYNSTCKVNDNIPKYVFMYLYTVCPT